MHGFQLYLDPPKDLASGIGCDTDDDNEGDAVGDAPEGDDDGAEGDAEGRDDDGASLAGSGANDGDESAEDGAEDGGEDGTIGGEVGDDSGSSSAALPKAVGVYWLRKNHTFVAKRRKADDDGAYVYKRFRPEGLGGDARRAAHDRARAWQVAGASDPAAAASAAAAGA